MKNLLLITIGLLMAHLSFSQNDIQGNIIGKGKPYKDRIALRWNINNYQVFRQMATDGVYIDRIILNNKNQTLSKNWDRITKTPIKAWPLTEIEKFGDMADTSVAVMTQILYGKVDYPKDLNLIEQIKYQDIDQQNRHLIGSLYASISKKAAEIAGMAFDDMIIPDSSQTYVYRITPAIPKGNVGSIFEGFAYVSGGDLFYDPFQVKLEAQQGENSVLITWPTEQSHYTGYFIERSTDRKIFKPLNPTIYLAESQTDSTSLDSRYSYHDSVTNYIPYYYRIYGVDAFGDKRMFTDTVKAMGIDKTPPDPPLLKMDKNGKKLTFTWGEAVDPDIKGYFLMRGKTIHAQDALLVEQFFSPKTNKYEYTLPQKFNSSFYKLMCVDTVGNISYSNAVYAFENDLTPPIPPLGLQGSIDTSGRVFVSWNLDTSEKAIMGYKVHYANQGDHQFIPASNIVHDTTYSFSIDLQNLSKNLYIKVVAVDGNYAHSDFSKILVLKKPDLIPPTPPQILDYKNTAQGIEVFWSKATDNDFLENVLYRKTSGEEEWKELLRTAKVHSFLDKSVLAGTAYEYSMRALDSSGLYSEYAFPIAVRTSNRAVSEKLDLTGTYNSQTKTVTLKWPKSKGEVLYHILYKDQGEGLTVFKSLPAAELQYSEEGNGSPKGKYAIKIKYTDNMESELFVCK